MNSPDFNKILQKARQFVQVENYAEALPLFAKLAKRCTRGDLFGEYGHAAALSGDFDLARQLWEKVRGIESNTADLLSRLASEYQNIGLHTKARELYAQAASLEPRNLDAQLNLAWRLGRAHGVDEARVAVNKCLELDARNELARYLSAYLDRRENKLAQAEQQFRDLIASAPRHPYVSHSCHYDLANILDRTGRFDEAMAQLKEGQRLARQNFKLGAEAKTFYQRLDHEALKAKSLPRNILGTWARSFPPRARTAPASLAFLTGAARSGTTLLERVLDAHPAVAACDESPAFQRIHRLIDITTPVIPAQRLNLLRLRYLKNLTTVLGAPCAGKVLLDKNPSQTAYLPAFLRVFPELRVLIGLRDPRDIMVSLYFQNQKVTNCLGFEELAQFYCKVMDVWLAVREWEGLVWMETRYEDVVADVQKEGCRVTKFLGLEWHENQARFYESNREKPIMSANYSDVTQPVYARSVARWRVYEKHLAPILPVLEPYCRRFRYT